MEIAPALRGLVSSGLLLLVVLLSLALSPEQAATAPRLAGLAAGAVLARVALASGLRQPLGAFADALDLAVGLGIALAAMALTGGLGSELYVLLLVDLVLARVFLGAPAARFLAVATLIGLGVLVALPGSRGSAPALGLMLRALWPLAVLVVLELWDARQAAARPALPAPVRETVLREPLVREPARPRAEERAPRPSATAQDKLLHDLRSPLTVIRLYADLLDEQARKGQPPAAPLAANLRAEVEMMQSLLRDPEAAGPRPEPSGQCDLLPLVQGLAGTYRLAHEGRLRIAFESDVSALVVAADPMAVRRAVRNALDNAVKFTPPGGEVRVRAGRQGGEAFVAVSDTGPGVAADEREKVFDFRYRGEAARSSGAAGSGLGLGLTRELLAPHGGRVTLSSQPGRGSEVTLLLPVA